MWRAITESDLLSAITGEEESAFRTKLLRSGQGDPFAAIFAQVTYNFREAIRSNPVNELDADPATLPEGAIFHAVAIIRHRLSSRFNTTEPSEARLLEYKDARDYLKAIAKKDGLAVEQPGATESAKVALPSPAVNESPRRDGWRNQDGI